MGKADHTYDNIYGYVHSFNAKGTYVWYRNVHIYHNFTTCDRVCARENEREKVEDVVFRKSNRERALPLENGATND